MVLFAMWLLGTQLRSSWGDYHTGFYFLKLSGLVVCCCHICHLHIPYSLIKMFSGFLTATAVLRPLLSALSFPKHHILKSCQTFFPKALISPESSHQSLLVYRCLGDCGGDTEEKALRFPELMPSPVSSLCLLSGDEKALSYCSNAMPAAILLDTMVTDPLEHSGNVNPKLNALFCKLPWSGFIFATAM